MLVYYEGGIADTDRDAEIAAAIAATKAEGIELTTTTGSAVSFTNIEMAGGTVRTIEFSKPAEVTINVDVDLTVDSTIYNLADDSQATTVIQNFFNSLGMSDDCIAHGYQSLESYLSTIAGVLDIEIDWAVDPTAAAGQGDANISIDYDEVAIYGAIAINSHV